VPGNSVRPPCRCADDPRVHHRQVLRPWSSPASARVADRVLPFRRFRTMIRVDLPSRQVPRGRASPSASRTDLAAC
jgi:hypothetical protein